MGWGFGGGRLTRPTFPIQTWVIFIAVTLLSKVAGVWAALNLFSTWATASDGRFSAHFIIGVDADTRRLTRYVFTRRARVAPQIPYLLGFVYVSRFILEHWECNWRLPANHCWHRHPQNPDQSQDRCKRRHGCRVISAVILYLRRSIEKIYLLFVCGRWITIQ